MEKTAIIIGQDRTLIGVKLAALLEAKQQPAEKVEKINLAELDYQTMLKKLTTSSFWEDGVLVVDHLEVYQKLTAPQQKKIKQALNWQPREKILIWQEAPRIKKVALPFQGTLYEVKILTKTEKHQQIKKTLNTLEKGQISASLKQELLNKLPDDFSTLMQCLAQIKAYCQAKKTPLTLPDLAVLLRPKRTQRVFGVIEMIVLKTAEITVLEAINDVPRSELYLPLWLKLLALYIKTVFEIKAVSGRIEVATIAAKSQKSPIFIRKIANLVPLVNIPWLVHLLQKGQVWELKLRQGKNNKNDMIKMFIVDLYNENEANC